MENPDQNLHFLMVSLPYQGHMNPLLSFAKILTSKGLKVTLATTEVARSRLANSTSNSDIEFEFFNDGLSLEVDREKNLGVLLECLPREGGRSLSGLISEQGSIGKTFSCIIINCFVPWVADVAADHGIPCAMLWVQACALFAIYYRYHEGINEFPPLDNPSNVVKLPGLPLLQVEDLPTFLLPSGPRHFYNVVASCIESLDKIQWIFSSSFLSLEQEIVHSMIDLKPICPIGPLLPSLLRQPQETTSGITANLWDTEDSCIQWLDTQPPSSVLYISFGSITVLSQSETEAVGMALESTRIPFLWVMKKGDEGWARKEGELPEGFVERTKERGRFVSWCPQYQVLMHSALACFLTHCGWNSTLETVAAGVPVIAYPEWTDQPTNAKLLVDVFETGVRMRRGEDEKLHKEEVERCIWEVTRGPNALKMKEKAADWKKAAKEAVDVGGSSHAEVESFIKAITKKNME